MLIYREVKGGRAEPVGEANTLKAMNDCFAAVRKAWNSTKKGRSFVADGTYAVARYSDGKTAFILFADVVPVPVVEVDAQPRRKGGAA